MLNLSFTCIYTSGIKLRMITFPGIPAVAPFAFFHQLLVRVRTSKLARNSYVVCDAQTSYALVSKFELEREVGEKLQKVRPTGVSVSPLKLIMRSLIPVTRINTCHTRRYVYIKRSYLKTPEPICGLHCPQGSRSPTGTCAREEERRRVGTCAPKSS